MSYFGKKFRVHVDMPSASENELEERKRREKGRICACGRGGGEIFVRTCTQVNERTRETDRELNEPTLSEPLANFLKTHLRPVFLLSEEATVEADEGSAA